MDMTDEIINKIEKCQTRDYAVVHYKNAINMTGIDIEWCKINDVIIKKWSLSGLKYIKSKVWS